MSKITNDGLTRSGTECFIALPIWKLSGRQWVNDNSIATLVWENSAVRKTSSVM